MVVEAGREGAGETAAAIAAVLTERGLGGDDPDLRHRLDQFRRDRSKPGGGGEGDGEAVGGECPLPRASPMIQKAGEVNERLFSRSPIPTASPRVVAAGAASFLLANGRGGTLDAASPLRAKRSWRWPN